MQFIKNLFKTSHKNTPEMKSYNPFMSMTLSQNKAEWSQCDYHHSTQSGYKTNPIVYSCVRMIADGASRVPVTLFEGQKNLLDHPLTRLLKSPSLACDGRQFKNALFHHLLLEGNAYIQCVWDDQSPYPKSLFLLRPDRVRCLSDDMGEITHYKYTTSKHHKYFRAEDIIHLKFFSPHDDYYGQSPTKAAWRAICLHNEAMTFQKALLDNAARPSGCLVYSGLPGAPNLSENQFLRLKSELQENYTGAAAAGRPMVLEGGLQWQNMALTPTDIGIHKMRYDAAREIALAYGVPPMLLAIPGDNTYSNYQEAIRVLTRNSLIPMAETFYDAFCHKISRHTHSDFHIKIDREQISQLFVDYFNKT